MNKRVKKFNDSCKPKNHHNPGIIKLNESKNINVLNDDCILHIFQHFSIVERFHLQKVCKRWNKLIDKSWNTVYELIINDKQPIYKLLSKNKNHKEIVSIMNKIFARCGNFLKTIELSFNQNNDFYLQMLLKIIDKYCSNILHLTIVEKQKVYDVNERTLSSIFLVNNNLKEINFTNLQIHGFCLLSLPKNSLEKIKITGSYRIEKIYLSKIIPHLKNLKKVYLNNFESIDKNFLEVLCNVNNKITEFSLEKDFVVYNNFGTELTQFFLEHKSLKLINLENFKIESTCFFNISNVIEDLRLSNVQLTAQTLRQILPDFKNLKRLFVQLDDALNDECMYAISMCKNLKELKLKDTSINLMFLKKENYFKPLTKLEIFGTFGEDNVSDEFLIALSECKKLKSVLLMNWYKNTVTDVGLNAITRLPNLKNLVTYGFDNITDKPFIALSKIINLSCMSSSNLTNEGFIKVVKNCQELKELNLSCCKNISNELIEQAIKIKENRSDKNILKIKVNKTKVNLKELQNLSFLINVIG